MSCAVRGGGVLKNRLFLVCALVETAAGQTVRASESQKNLDQENLHTLPKEVNVSIYQPVGNCLFKPFGLSIPKRLDEETAKPSAFGRVRYPVFVSHSHACIILCLGLAIQ